MFVFSGFACFKLNQAHEQIRAAWIIQSANIQLSILTGFVEGPQGLQVVARAQFSLH